MPTEFPTAFPRAASGPGTARQQRKAEQHKRKAREAAEAVAQEEVPEEVVIPEDVTVLRLAQLLGEAALRGRPARRLPACLPAWCRGEWTAEAVVPLAQPRLGVPCGHVGSRRRLGCACSRRRPCRRVCAEAGGGTAGAGGVVQFQAGPGTARLRWGRGWRVAARQAGSTCWAVVGGSGIGPSR